MAETTDDQNPGVARRSVLRSAAAAGGAALWAVPAVQVLATSVASAQSTSPAPGITETPPATPPGSTPPVATPPGTTPPPAGGTTPPAPGTTPPTTGGTSPPGTTPVRGPARVTPGSVTAPAVQGGAADRRLARTGVEVSALAAAGAGLVAGGVAVAKASGHGRHAAGGAGGARSTGTPAD